MKNKALTTLLVTAGFAGTYYVATQAYVFQLKYGIAWLLIVLILCGNE